MGNAAASAFREEPVGTGTLTGKMGRCIAPATVSTSPLDLSIRVTSMMSKTSEIVDASSGKVLYTFTSSMGFRKLTITVTDASGALVCKGFGKDGLQSATFRVLRPSPAFKGQPEATEKLGEAALYTCATCEINKGFASATATYSTIKGDEDGQAVPVKLYEARKLRAFAFLLAVENLEGELVAKVTQNGIDNRKLAGAVGKGVDVVAAMLISAFVGIATGSAGGAVGGMVGAGVV